MSFKETGKRGALFTVIEKLVSGDDLSEKSQIWPIGTTS